MSGDCEHYAPRRDVNMIDELWKRIEHWGTQNAPKMLEDLNSGASEEQIAHLENVLGISLPETFKASLKIHNGENDGWPYKVFAAFGAYLGTERIEEEWKLRQEISGTYSHDENSNIDELIREGILEVTGPVNPELFLKEWIPIMDCNGDIFWAIDFKPSEGGNKGQIIEVDLEACSWKVISESFERFLSDYVSRLENGEYIVVDGLPEMDENP